MRGRCLLKDASGTYLCAFCAHTLGQARMPSLVQRRFLQSSTPISRQTGEATAPKDDYNRIPHITKNQRSSSVPGELHDSAPEVNRRKQQWGQETSGANVPDLSKLLPHERRARMLILEQQSRLNRTQSESSQGPRPETPSPNFRSIAPQQQRQGSQQAYTPDFSNLLPHERSARESILKMQTKTAQRPVTINRGPGPSTTRGGRYEPPVRKTQEEQLADAQRMERVRVAQERFIADKNRPKTQLHPVRNPVEKDDRNPQQTAKVADKSSDSWSQLQKASGGKKRAKVVEGKEMSWVAESEELLADFPKPEKDFTEGRADREKVAKFANYTPLADKGSSRSAYFPDQRSNQYPDPWGSTYHRSNEWANTPRNLQSERSAASNFVSQQEDAAPSRRDKKQKKGRGGNQSEEAINPKNRGKDRDRQKKLAMLANDEIAQEKARAVAKERKERKALKAASKIGPPTPIILPEYITVVNLATALKVRVDDFAKKMESLGFEETNYDYILTAENAGLIAMEYNFEPIIERGESEDLKAREPASDKSLLPPRPPVVTIMGHVDHGKTTLLDYLRKSSVAAGEHGGITQHIGAFSVPMPGGRTITFLDTPGHAAFLSMRQRGANVTDIVILVVAADDSVKPQTIEAIRHAKSAKVPMIVAINKIDKEDCDIEKVKQDLARNGVEIEDYGGDTQVVCVSGKTGQGMDELEEAASTLSEILDMRAETDGPVEGWIIDASLKSLGKVATVLVRRGTLRAGDFIVAGQTWSRIKCLRNEAGVEIEEAGPGMPVEIDGWREQPVAGDEVLQAPDEARAKSVVQYRLEREERNELAKDMEAINEFRTEVQEKRDREKEEKLRAKAKGKSEDDDLNEVEATEAPKESGPKQVFFIVKGDVSGSVEAVIESISPLGNKEVQAHVLRSGVGPVSEFDVEHAAAAKGFVLNFNTELEPHIVKLAHQLKVTILDRNIIYNLVDDVRAELSKHLSPLITYKVLGEAEVSMVFSINIKGRKFQNIAGCKVRNGTIAKTAKVRVMRDGEKVFDGQIASLKHVKKDVPEMKKGTECGIGFEGWFDFVPGDQVQTYLEIVEKRYL